MVIYLDLHLEVRLEVGQQREEDGEGELEDLRHGGDPIFWQGHTKVLLNGIDEHLVCLEDGPGVLQDGEEQLEGQDLGAQLMGPEQVRNSVFTLQLWQIKFIYKVTPHRNSILTVKILSRYQSRKMVVGSGWGHGSENVLLICQDWLLFCNSSISGKQTKQDLCGTEKRQCVCTLVASAQKCGRQTWAFGNWVCKKVFAEGQNFNNTILLRPYSFGSSFC